MSQDNYFVFYAVIHSLLMAIAFAGLTLSLRFWRRGASPKLASAAFGLAVFGQAGHLPFFAGAIFAEAWADQNAAALSLVFGLSDWLLVVAGFLTVVAFWQSWRETAAAEDATLPTEACGPAP